MYLVAAGLSLALFSLCVQGGPAAPEYRPRVADLFAVYGYLPEYRLGGFNYSAAFSTGLTHLIFFSLEIDDRGFPSALDRLPSKAQARQARAAADAVGGKIIMSFGGNARSAGFPKMALTRQSRLKFLMKVDKMLRDYEFDGVDYNWEYPRSEVEWRQWGELMKESKEVLLRPAGSVMPQDVDAAKLRHPTDPDFVDAGVLKERDRAAAAANYKNNVVTFTMYLDENHYDIIKRHNLLRHADAVHCMAYDQHGPHSTMAFAQRGLDLAEQYFPKSLNKFTLGLPFYARSVDDGSPKTYQEMEAAVGADPALDMHGRYYFNGARTIAEKTRLARDKGILGVMIWELGQDVQPLSKPNSLMTALFHALSHVQQDAHRRDRTAPAATRDEL